MKTSIDFYSDSTVSTTGEIHLIGPKNGQWRFRAESYRRGPVQLKWIGPGSKPNGKIREVAKSAFQKHMNDWL